MASRDSLVHRVSRFTQRINFSFWLSCASKCLMFISAYCQNALRFWIESIWTRSKKSTTNVQKCPRIRGLYLLPCLATRLESLQSSVLSTKTTHQKKGSRCHEVQLVSTSCTQLSVNASLSSENKMSSSSASSKPWNVEASLSEALPNNSSRAFVILPRDFAPPLPATMKTSASEQHRQGHTLSQLFYQTLTW